MKNPFLFFSIKTATVFAFISLSLCCSKTYAQTVFERRNDIPVYANGYQQRFPWTGGFNNPQFSAADLNNDGLNDLFVFDRSGEVIHPLINNGTPNQTDYFLDYNYAIHFPHLHNWVLMRDFNCDNVPDIFTSANGDGVAIYAGAWGSDGKLSFTLTAQGLAYAPNNDSITIALYDIPAITDLDDDGDLDILTFAPSGGYVGYFRNRAVENGMPCGTFDLIEDDHCWGDFYESGLSTSLSLNHSCPGITEGGGDDNEIIAGNNGSESAEMVKSLQSSLHPGSTLLIEDLDGNGAKDIILGDISFSNLVAAFNGGTSANAFMTSQDTLFPSYNVPLNLTIFPAAFSIDVNNDGRRDMLVSPNTIPQSQHYQCVWYYQNTSPTAFDYVLQSDTFLIDQMIDVNRLAAPAFFDHNNDGLLDLVVGNYGYFDNGNEYHTQLALYENTGTATQPAFTLRSKNYMNVGGQFGSPRRQLKPCFGDVDGDGDMDMLVGDETGIIHYFNNQPNANNEAVFILAGEQWQGLDIYQQASPQLVDMDEDGLLDLIVGHHNGEIQYRHNNGTATSPNFMGAPTNTYLGGIDVQVIGTTTGKSTPQMVQRGNERLLYVGSEVGVIRVFSGIDANSILSGGVFNELTNPTTGVVLKNGAPLYAGQFSKPAIADLDNDGRLDMVVGLYQGGLVWYEEAEPDAIAPTPTTSVAQIDIRPNPAQTYFVLNAPDIQGAVLYLYNTAGQLVLQQNVEARVSHVAVANLPNGIYLVQVVSKDGVYEGKLLKY